MHTVGSRVLVIARISTIHQDKRSLDDQVAYCKEWVEKNLKGPLVYVIEKSQGSGENLERPELARFEKLIETGKVTHVVCEESSRLCRRYFTIAFCELCEDHGVRFIAINDNIDTSVDWRINSMFSSVKHEMSNKDTSNRIRRSLRNRFSQGGIVQYQSFGYIKPPGAKHDRDLRKDEALIPFVEGIFQRIEEGASYSEVADWLNQEGVPVGKQSRTNKWDSNKVRRIVKNPIYKGVRERNRMISRRVNKSGRHLSIKAPPEDLLIRECPHLCIIDPVRFDLINALVQQRNWKYSRGRLDAVDTRKGVPRKRTVWGGQHFRCATCKSLYYWGGHGQKARMMCSGRREYRCWNGASCNGLQLAQEITKHALSLIETFPEFKETFLEQVRQEVQGRRRKSSAEKGKLQQEVAKLERQIDNLTTAIADGRFSDAIMNKVRALESECNQCNSRLRELKVEDHLEVQLPSIEVLKQIARERLDAVDYGDPVTHRLLCRIFPVVELQPCMMVDQGSVVLRAVVTMHLEALMPGFPSQLGAGLLKKEFTIDLFQPPQRELVRKEVMQFLATRLSKKEIARRLGVAPLVVDRAIKLQEMLDRLELSDPIHPLAEPPAGSKLKSHKHLRFQPPESAAG